MRILPIMFLAACSSNFGESYDVVFDSYIDEEEDSLSFNLAPNDGFALVNLEFTTSEMEDIWSNVVWIESDSEAVTVVMHDVPDTGWLSIRGFGDGLDGERQFCEINDYGAEVFPIGWWNIAIRKDSLFSEWGLSQTVFTDGVCTLTYNWHVTDLN